MSRKILWPNKSNFKTSPLPTYQKLVAEEVNELRDKHNLLDDAVITVEESIPETTDSVDKYDTTKSTNGKAIHDYFKNSGLHLLTFANAFDSNFDQFGNFNGGVISLDNNRLQVVTDNSAEGCYIKPEFVPNNTEHYLLLDIDLNDITSVIFYNKWAVVVQEITESGRYTIPFTSDNSGAFPYPILRATSTGTFYINELSLFVVNQNPMYVSAPELVSVETDISEMKSGLPVAVFNETFEGASYHNDVNAFNGGVLSLNQLFNRLEVTASSASRGFNIDNLETNSVYLIEVDIDLNGLSYVRFCNYWNNEITRLESSGKHSIKFTNVQSGGFPDPLFVPNDIGTFYINSIKIQKNVPWALTEELSEIKEDIDFTDVDNSFRDYGAGTTGESLALGDGVGSNARSTRVGYLSHQLGQSGTVLGCGAENTVSHGIAIGRGSKLHYVNNGVVLGGKGNTDLYMGNSWAHRSRVSFSGISGGYYEPDSSVSIKGVNSWDARPYYHPFDTGRSYKKYEDAVDSNGQIYLSLTDNNQNNAFPVLPILKNTYWSNITHLFKDHTEFYPPNPNQIYALPLSTWASGYSGEIGRFISHSGSQYIRIASTDNTIAPDVSSDYLDVSTNWNGTTSRLECDYFKIHNPATYNTSQMTVKWECVWISKIDNNTNIPPINRQEDSNWHCVHNPNVKHWLIHFDKGHEYDTRHDFNKDGGNLNLDAGTGTGTGKSGSVVLRAHVTNPSEIDGNKQGVLEGVAEFHGESGTDTQMRLVYFNVNTNKREMKDVKIEDTGDGKGRLYIDI